MVAEAQQELVIVDFDIQFLLALRDGFLQVLRQQLDEFPVHQRQKLRNRPSSGSA